MTFAEALHQRVPYLLPPWSALGSMGSDPPGPELLNDPRLPFPVMGAYLSRKLAIPGALVAFPDDPAQQTSQAGLLAALADTVGDNAAKLIAALGDMDLVIGSCAPW